MKKIIEELADKLKDIEITYSMSTYLLAVLIEENIITIDKLKDKIKEVEDTIPPGNELTENMSKNKLKKITSMIEKHTNLKVTKTDKQIKNKMYVIAFIFENNKYVVLPAYKDKDKMQNAISKIVME